MFFLKTLKVQFRFLRFLCNLINERHIQILIVLCEIRQFHLHFSGFTFFMYGMFFVCFWVVLTRSVFVPKSLKDMLSRPCHPRPRPRISRPRPGAKTTTAITINVNTNGWNIKAYNEKMSPCNFTGHVHFNNLVYSILM